jgi:exopolyphosphatase/pppGpp-phosphohydrolase
VKYTIRTGISVRALVLAFVGVLSTSLALGQDRYGGIEIGAKGVKASAVEVTGSGDTAQLKILSLDKKTVDVTISRLKDKKFSEVKLDDVAQVVKSFHTALQDELQVPAENIRVVASSGVPFAENFADLVTAVQEQTGAELSKIEAKEEASLTNLALVPTEWRTQTLVVDIGSGNTKGGIFLTEAATAEDFVALEAKIGTATLSKAVDDQAQADGKTRAEVIEVVTANLAGEPLRQQIGENPELIERQKILFSGGSVWAAITIMHPETALEPFPIVRVSDLKAYAERLAASPGEYPEINFAQIEDEAARKVAQGDYARITGAAGTKAVFTPEELQAGAALLIEVADSLQFEGKSVYFDRSAVTAWITAYITPEEMRGLLPAALGRNLPEAPVVAEAKSGRFGGIEIGAKGIKVSAVEVDGTELKILSLDKKTVDVTISRLKDKKFNEVKIEDVVEVVKSFQEALKTELEIPVQNIRVVASSGVPFADNFADLVTAIQEQTGAELVKIDAKEEATLTNLALVPKDWRTETLVLDIGSGNTKGGIFTSENATAEDFIAIEVPYGTATLSKAIDDQAQADGKSRAEVAPDLTNAVVGKPLQEQLAENMELGQRKRILCSGGSVWAAVTIMRPESALNPFPVVRAVDLKAYSELLAKTPGKYPELDFSRVADPAARKVAQGDYDRIRGAAGSKAVFTPEELQAGAALLNEVAESLDFDSKTVLFDRKAVTAWITAYITPEELRDAIPASLGRALPDVDNLPADPEPAPPAVTTTTPPTTPPVVTKPMPPVPAPMPTTPMPPMPMPTTSKPDPSGAPGAPVATKPPMPLAGAKDRAAGPPEGLTKPAPELLKELLFLPNKSSDQTVAYTADFCHEVGIKCYESGLYQDALAFTKQALTLREQPSTLYLKGLIEIALNQSDEANLTAAQIRKAGGSSVEIIGPLRERLNGPRAVRLVRLIDSN